MFAGAYHRTPYQVAPSLTNELLSVLNRFDQADATGIWENDSFAIAHTVTHNTPESFLEATPFHCPRSGIVIAAWSRLDRRATLATALGMHADLSEISDSMLILSAWQRWGANCPAKLQGDFSFAIADTRTRQLFLARDPIGIRPLYYHLDATKCRFSTTAAVFSRIKAWRAAPAVEWMARFLLPNAVSALDRTSTALCGVLKLEPGHSLLVSPEHATLQRYHSFSDDPPLASVRELRWLNEYRAVLEGVIRDQMRSSHTLGAENSGGLDSATITALVARELGESSHRLTTFSFALAEHESDYIRETVRAYRILQNHVLTERQKKTDELYERGLAVMGFPQEHGVATAHIPFYEACQRANIRTLFSGFGGDEVVTNSGQHLRTELLDRRDYAALLGILPGSALGKGLRLLKAIATSKTYATHSPSWQQGLVAQWPYHLLKHNVVTEFGLFDSYMAISAFYAPYRRINEFALTGRLCTGYVPARLENCSLLAQSYGVEYRWPLLDTRLIQQYLSTPSVEKFGPNAVRRFLHRRAVDGVVPHRVAWKPTKDMGYEKLLRYRNQTEIIAAAKEAARQEANLHSELAVLIDRQKFREQIARAALGNVDREFGYVFRRSSESIRWLNHWLHGSAVE